MGKDQGFKGSDANCRGDEKQLENTDFRGTKTSMSQKATLEVPTRTKGVCGKANSGKVSNRQVPYAKEDAKRRRMGSNDMSPSVSQPQSYTREKV